MLFYQSYFPSPRLSEFVARYIMVSDDQRHADWQQMEVIPNGLPGLVFPFGGNFRYETAPDSRQEISSSHVIGVHNCNYTGSWKGPVGFFAIIFKPFGLFPLLMADMKELRNSLTSFGMLGLKDAEGICESLSRLSRHEDKIRCIEQWLETRLACAGTSPGISAHIAQSIIERKGAVSISGMSREFQINRRYLERHFSRELGLSPKEFAGIIRFNYLRALLLQDTVTWKELTYLCDFHDQSHLIKHFHRITGVPPRVFKEMSGQWPEATFIIRHNVYELISGDAPIIGDDGQVA